MRKTICIEKEVPITIFEDDSIKKEVERLFNNIKYEFSIRIIEVLSTIHEEATGVFSADNLLSIFKVNFFEIVLNDAIDLTLKGENNYNLKQNILNILLVSEENLRQYIYSNVLINTISEALYSIPTKSTLDSCIYRSKIAILYDKYVEDDIDYY